MPAIPGSTRDSIISRLNLHARQHWPQLTAVQVSYRGQFAYATAILPGGEHIPLFRLRYTGSAHDFGFAICNPARDRYDDILLLTGLPIGTPQQALDTAAIVHLTGLGHEPPPSPPTNLRCHPLKERTEFTVPVYLCDSLRWGQQDDLFSHKGLSVRTTLEHEDLLYDPEFTGDTVFSERLKFPDAVLADAGNFDRLVRELASKATDDDKTQRDTLPATFRTHGIPEDCRAMIRQSFENMCHLHDDERDHIWGYYVRNLARPVWMARPDNRVDVLVGNPPWLSYKGMTRIQKKSFADICEARKIWSGASLTPTNNLAAFFVARSIELYLKPEGHFGFVMPGGTLGLQHYERFRTGQYSSNSEQVTVAFDTPWDLSKIQPYFFQQAVGAVFGHRTTAAAATRAMGGQREEWSGHFTDTKTARLADALPHITRHVVDECPAGQTSPYMGRFFQGAAVVPQILFLIQDDPTGPIGAGAGRRAVRTYRTPGMHPPWNTTPPIQDVVEEQFIKHLYLGSTLLPFRLLAPRQAVLPWDDRLVDDDSLDLYPNLHRWWRKAENAWREKHGDAGMSLLKQLNYNRKLSRQFPVPAYRVVYPKSGIHCAAAVVTNETYKDAVIDQQLYWGTPDTLEEARYLSAILNAPTVTSEIHKSLARTASTARSAQSGLGRATCRRSTATS